MQLQLAEPLKLSVDGTLEQLNGAIRKLDQTSKGAQKRTQRPESQGSRSPKQPPPQVVLLHQAFEALKVMARGSQDARLTVAVAAFEPAVRQHTIPRAIGLLDDLKAEGVQLATDVEAARKQLRSLIGWSPLAPVSLEEALIQQGIALETDREERVVRSMDRALVTSLGGRGERYESVLRAISESVATELG